MKKWLMAVLILAGTGTVSAQTGTFCRPFPSCYACTQGQRIGTPCTDQVNGVVVRSFINYSSTCYNGCGI